MAEFAHHNGDIFIAESNDHSLVNYGMVNGHGSILLDKKALKSNNFNGNLHSERITRKAKRPSKYLSYDFNRTKSDTSIVAPLRALKNSRKSRNRYGRGLPKKGIIYLRYVFLFNNVSYHQYFL